LPQGALGRGKTAVLWGKDRAALLDCGTRKRIETEFYAGRDKALAGK